MNIAEPLIRIEKRLKSLESLVDDVEILKESLNQVAQDLNKVIQCLDSLKEAYTQKKCTTEKSKEKYRPYTVMELIRHYPIGSHIHFRPKDKTMEMHRLVDGYNDCKNGAGTLFMCGIMFSMSELYDNYEIFKDGEWKPFGIIEE